MTTAVVVLNERTNVSAAVEKLNAEYLKKGSVRVFIEPRALTDREVKEVATRLGTAVSSVTVGPRQTEILLTSVTKQSLGSVVLDEDIDE